MQPHQSGGGVGYGQARRFGEKMATGQPCPSLVDCEGAHPPLRCSVRRRAAGGDVDKSTQATIAAGVGSVQWSAVPSGIFDAAEDTVSWSIEAFDETVTAVVRVELSGPGSPNGIVVRLRSGPFGGAGVLRRRRRAVFPVVDSHQQPISESAAWGHDWRISALTIGADAEESAQTRERIRDFARSRLASPAADAFLAEILAAESDY